MKFDFKRIIAGMLCATLVLALASCGKTEQKRRKKQVIVVNKNNTSSIESAGGDDNDNYENDNQNQIPNQDYITDNSPGNTVTEDAYVSDRYIPTVEETAAKGEHETPHAAEYKSWNGPEGYSIVYPDGNKAALGYAELLKSFFADKGVSLDVKADSAKATAKEILVGNTNRKKTSLKENMYSVSLDGGKLVFAGGSDTMLKSAVQVFTRLEYKKGKAATFSKTTDFKNTVLDNYSFIWGDEFDGPSLDRSLWDLQTRMGATAEMELSTSEKNIKVENGYLKMLATRTWNPKIDGAEFACPYSVTTATTMSFKYGYLEMRARVPYERGAWPSFWSSSANTLGPQTKADYTIEVDFLESFASTDSFASNLHKWYGDGRHTQYPGENLNKEKRTYYFENPDNLSDEYHTYGFEWTPTEMKMYIDGKRYITYDLTYNFDASSDSNKTGMSGFDTQLAIILNNHLFTESSDWKPYSGCEIYFADLPMEYDIDYIRLYQKNDNGSKLYTK